MPARRLVGATAADGAAPEHHRRRARQRLDGVVQRPLLAVARVRARRLRGPAGQAASAPVDVVPVDYVADAIFALSQAPRRRARRSTSPPERRRARVGELVELATALFRRPQPRLVDPALYRRVVHPLLVRATRRRALPARAQAQRGLLPLLRHARSASTTVAPAWRCAGLGSAHAAAHLLRPAGRVRARGRLGAAADSARRRGARALAPPPGRAAQSPQARPRLALAK